MEDIEEDNILAIPGNVVTKYKPKPPPNPGRKKGSKNRLTLLREAVLNKQEEVILNELPKIVEIVCRKAAEGDLSAAKLILERIIPIRKQSDGNEGSKGPPVITINIEAAKSERKRSSITIETPQIIEHGEFEEVDEDEE
jgi:hypothetical protein